MKTESIRRPMGATILAVLLGWLGVAGLFNAVAWPLVMRSELMRTAPSSFVAQFPSELGSWWFSAVALVYGITAITSARSLWRVTSTATVANSAWATSVVLVFVCLFVMQAETPVAAFALLLAVLVVLLGMGGLYIRRLVRA